MFRSVQLVRASRPTLEGAGVHLHRAFGPGDEQQFDPFLMLDDFRGDHPSLYRAGFPWHPHRGIETITYVIEGEVDHGDSMGNQGTIGPGDVQWMTAGSGIIHQEMPRGSEGGRMGGFQLWANLPAAQKMMDPRYRGIEAADIPEVEEDGARVRVIAGRMGDVLGPVQDITVQPEYLDVALAPGAVWTHPTRRGHTVFAYLYEGTAAWGDPRGKARETVSAAPGTLVVLGDGDELGVEGGENGARFLLVSGAPLREPIAWRGPIVMNTTQQLEEAWRELDAGTFVKPQANGG